MSNAKPFLKWIGGKGSLLPELRSRIPGSFLWDSYFEPFVGGGALFFDLEIDKNAYLSDVNRRLVQTYRALQFNVQAVISELENHKEKHSPEYYYEIRKQFQVETIDVLIAGMMIYLNKTCFNGLYRENKSGNFNSACGTYKNPVILDRENLLAVSQILQKNQIHLRSFKDTPILPRSFYYLDPPYHGTWVGYNRSGFNEDHQREVLEFCHKIHEVGSFFMVSNSNTEFIRELWKGFNLEVVSVFRKVSSNGKTRNKAEEVIIRNYSTNRPVQSQQSSLELYLQ